MERHKKKKNALGPCKKKKSNENTLCWGGNDKYKMKMGGGSCRGVAL